MASGRVNVLVYTGPGTSLKSVQHTIFTLRRILTPHYAVVPLSSETLLNEPWTPTAACLIIPGGADLPYCRVLNGAGNRIISRYVRNGGRYIGFCAGGYYATKRVIWEAGKKGMEVVGDRELAFFPGTGRGCAYDGFDYGSERGMRAVRLDVQKGTIKCTVDSCVSYYNGGGVFIQDPDATGFEILAKYIEPTECDPSGVDAAIVYCKVGEGAALITGPHPEFAPELLKSDPSIPDHAKHLRELQEGSEDRDTVLRACLDKLGLKGCAEKGFNAFSLSTMHLSSRSAAVLQDLSQELEEMKDGIVQTEIREDSGPRTYTVKGETDTFVFVDGSERGSSSAFSMESLKRSLPSSNSIDNEQDAWKRATLSESAIPDFSDVSKTILIHSNGKIPNKVETPRWDHRLYLSACKEAGHMQLGDPLLYAEVTTSTNTLLVSNLKLLKALPHGSVFVATNQIAGRGRGSNVWVSPPGCLMFSLAVSYKIKPSSKAGTGPVVFVQYLIGMAVVQAVRAYGKDYEQLEVRLKWPNDIYARPRDAPTAMDAGSREGFVKIGGILVQSVFSSPETLHLVIGVGLNVSNPAPTTSLDSLVASCDSRTQTPPPSGKPLPPFVPERLLPRILTSFELLYNRFLDHDWDEALEKEYYAAWLHKDQSITLEEEGGVQARVRGISRDWGMLIVEEIGLGSGRPTGRRFEVTSDGNSFDFMRGLVRRKA